MRARWLKPDFFTDKKIATMPPETALVFQALWVWADDGGVCICDPDYLKSQAFHRWSVFTIEVITRAIRELSDLKRISVYRIGDDYFAEIRHWSRHQAVHKPSKFRHPRPDQQLTLEAVDFPGTAPIPVPHQSQIRQLDRETPRRLDGEGAAAPLPEPVAKVTVPETQPPPPPPQPPDDFIPKTGKVAGELSLARRLDTDVDRLALAALCATVPAPHQWVAEANGRLDGMNGPGGKAITPRQLGDALGEFIGNGEHLKSPPSFRRFKAYLDAPLTSEQPAPETGQGHNGTGRRATDGGNAAPVSTGEAGTILAKIKGFRETSTPQAGGVNEFIRRARVEELGPLVLAAYDGIGGADVVLKTAGDKWGFLIRDFAAALTHARNNPPPSTDA